MTVQTTQSYVDYLGNGSNTLFVIPFPFLDLPEHIAVYDIDLGVAGKIAYTQGVDYAVIGIPTDPRVQFTVAPPSGKKIQIRRTIPITQLLDYLETGTFPAESHEKGLDKLTMIVQQVNDLVVLGDFIFGDFMSKGPHPALAGLLSWQGQGLELTNLSPGTEAASAVTLSQLNAAITGGEPATLSGQTALYFSGNAILTTFTLAGIQDIDADDINVYINGVHQSAHATTGAYTVSNAGNPLTDSTMTFGVAPPVGTNNIMVVFPSGAVSVTVSAGSVNSAAIIDGSVGVNELAPGSVVGQVIIWTGTTWTYAVLTSANITNFNAAVSALPVNTLAAATGSLNLGNQKIINLQAGTNPTDAINLSQLTNYKRSKSGTVPSTWYASGANIATTGWLAGRMTLTFIFGYGGAATAPNATTITVAFAADGTWRIMHLAQDPDGATDEERYIPVNFSRTGQNITIIGEPGSIPGPLNVGTTHYHITEA